MKEPHSREDLVLPQADDSTTQGQQAPILHAHGLTKEYRSGRATLVARALNGIDLDVYQRNFVSIMGPSGSGKTTLLNLFAGLDRPSSGEVWLQEHNMGTLSANQMALFRRRHLGFVFQDFNLLDTLTLAENVALPLSLDKRSSKEIQQRVEECMESLGIAQYRQRYPYEVSGGQQQRTAIARAVVHRPLLLLADEPTGNLDSASARALLVLLQQLNEQQQVTTLMVTHDPLAASYSKRVVFLKDGQVSEHLERTTNQQAFFQHILDILARLEGNHELA